MCMNETEDAKIANVVKIDKKHYFVSVLQISLRDTSIYMTRNQFRVQRSLFGPRTQKHFMRKYKWM